jgi:hypothetical protein
MKQEERLSMRDASYEFVNALSRIMELNKEKVSAKIVIYGKCGICDTITFRHNEESFDDYEFLAKNNNVTREYIVILKDDPTKVLNCRLLSHDSNKELFVFLMKPEFTRLNKKPFDI